MAWRTGALIGGGALLGGPVGAGLGAALSSPGRDAISGLGDRLSDAGGWVSDRLDRTRTGFEEVDPSGRVSNLADTAGQRAGRAHDRFEGTGQRMGQSADRLEALARGEDSLAQEQLRQGLGQALAQQQAHAAGARPGQQAAAARTAAQQMGQQASGAAGQAAQAGIQERQAAEQGLAQVLGQQRGQDLAAAQGMMGQQMGALGQLEGARGQRHAIGAGQPTPFEHGMSATMGAVPAIAGAISDERAKTDVRSGDREARGLLDALSPQHYRYRDEARHGEGERLGVMAQDLEQSDLGRALVQETPEGKAVDVPGLATTLAGLVGHLGERVEQLEGGGAREHPQARLGRQRDERAAREHPQARLARRRDAREAAEPEGGERETPPMPEFEHPIPSARRRLERRDRVLGGIGDAARRAGRFYGERTTPEPPREPPPDTGLRWPEFEMSHEPRESRFPSLADALRSRR